MAAVPGGLSAFDIGADGGLSNRQGFADGLGPHGICLDAEGAVWVSTGGFSVVRIAECGEILQRVEQSTCACPDTVLCKARHLLIRPACSATLQ